MSYYVSLRIAIRVILPAVFICYLSLLSVIAYAVLGLAFFISPVSNPTAGCTLQPSCQQPVAFPLVFCDCRSKSGK